MAPSSLVHADRHRTPRGRLVSEYARVLAIGEGNYDAAQSAFAQALAFAQREQDATLEMRTLTYACYVDRRPTLGKLGSLIAHSHAYRAQSVEYVWEDPPPLEE